MYFDLLYPTIKLREESRRIKYINDNLIDDLQVNELVSNISVDHKEMEHFCEEISYLPTNEDIINFRQLVLMDFIENPTFVKDLLEICEKLTMKLPEKKVNIYDSSPFHIKLKEYLTLLNANYNTLYGTRLYPKTTLKSDVLNNVYEFLENKEYENNLKEMIELVTSFVDAGAIELDVENTYGQIMNKVRILDIKSEHILPLIEGKTWKRKKTIDTNQMIEAKENFIIENNLNEIYIRILLKLCDFITRVNNRIVTAFKQIFKDSTYYKIGVSLYEFCKNQNLPLCIPEIVHTSENILETKELFSLNLALRLYHQENQYKVNIQSNDYSNERGKIAIITGTNSGGKTIFLQSIGIAQILMQLGFYVPAKSYKATIAQYIGTLFAVSEDNYTIHGKLEKELVMIKDMSSKLKRNSLILMNEILATTSEEEAALIAADVIRAFAITNSNIIFVTHSYEFANMAEKQELQLPEGEKAVNYITEYSIDEDGKSHKTYRMIPGLPMKNIWVEDMIDRYFEIKN